MKRRRNALICLLVASLTVTLAPAEVLAQEVDTGSNVQKVQEPEGEDKQISGELPDEPVNEAGDSMGEGTGKPDEGLKDNSQQEPEWKLEGQDSRDAVDKYYGFSEGDAGEKKDKERSEDDKEDAAGETETEKELPQKEDAEAEEQEDDIVVDSEDPGKYRLTGRGTGDFSSSGLRAQSVSHQEKYSDCILQHGIDVSYHNGKINWEKVKADGIDFAIIRVAYRGYENGALRVDTEAVENMKNANAAGIPIGVYIFSQAISAAEARQEADFIVNNIRGYQIDLPVVLDFEYVATGVGRLYKAKLSKSAATSVCTAFCDRVKALGYTPMVYASKTMYEDKTYAADVSQEYSIWMAHYNNSTSYGGEYEYWQYTSKGKVDGVKTKDNPYVDLNYRYYNSLRITKKAVGSLTMEWEPWGGAPGYDIYRKSSDGNYAILKSGVQQTAFTDTSLKAGTSYSYKIYPQGTNTCIGFNTGITQLPTTKLSGKGTAFDKIKLTWSKVSGASSYYIQRYNSSKKTYSNVKTASGKSSSYTEGSKNASTKYKYRIRPYKVVFNGRSYGNYSQTVTVKTKGKVKAKTKVKKLKLRKSASKSAKSLGTIKKKGTKVTVTGSTGSWYRLSVKINGKTRTGYIKKSSLKLIKK